MFLYSLQPKRWAFKNHEIKVSKRGSTTGEIEVLTKNKEQVNNTMNNRLKKKKESKELKMNCEKYNT